jgi:hypothetical protein
MLAEAVLEIVDHFGAASYETQKVEGHWRYVGISRIDFQSLSVRGTAYTSYRSHKDTVAFSDNRQEWSRQQDDRLRLDTPFPFHRIL